MSRDIALKNLKDKMARLHGDNVKVDESTYVNAKTKAKFIDKDYGEWWALPGNIIRGQGHISRGIARREKLLRVTIEEIKQRIFNIHGDKITIDESTYCSGHKHAKFIDKDYGEWSTQVSHVLRGTEHPERYIKECMVTPLQEVIDQLQLKHGDKVKIIESTYIGTHISATFHDTEFGEWNAYPKNVMNGSQHPTRGAQRIKNARHLAQRDNVLPNGKSVQTYCKERGISNSTSPNSYYNRVSPEAAQFWIDNYTSGISHLEQVFIKLMPEAKRYDRAFRHKKTDVIKYRPDFTLTKADGTILYIEVDGLFWHSEKNPKIFNRYHFKKREYFLPYTLLQFREDEIYRKSEIVRSMILTKAGLNVRRLQARKLEIKIVERVESSVFWNKTHLMGNFISGKVVGLYLENELVMSVGYKKYKDGIELTRVSTALNTSVAGGLSRLLAHLEKTLTPKVIRSFVDLRYGNGDSLKALSFELVSMTLGWKWTDGFHSYNRLACKANMDDRRLSEKEYASELGWYKIYDAGQAQFIKKCS